MNNLSTYATYYSAEEAKDLVTLLEDAGIRYEVEHNKDLLDKIYIGDNLDPMFEVKIPIDKFEYVNDMLRSNAKHDFNNIHPDYYLFNFTDKELIDVVNNKNEWNAFDQGLAEKILSDRKVSFDRKDEERVESSTYVSSKVTGLILIVEYLVALLVPYAGILIGVATIAAFRTLQNGKRVKIYDETTRMHGAAMILIGIVRTLTYLIIYL